MDPEKLLLESLDDLERIAAFACRRSGFQPADTEDFASFVKLKLIENDYAILRKFEGRSAFRTWLTIVVQRLMADYRNRQLGKWRPSAESKRLGEAAIFLETLMHRDQRTFEEAAPLVESRHPELTRTAVEALRGKLPPRMPRRREVALEQVHSDPAFDPRERHGPGPSESAALARRTCETIRRAIDAMPEAERLILRLRFEAGMTVAEIARALQIDATPLYRRIQKQLAALRTRLESEGVGAEEAANIVDSRDSLDFGFEPRLAAAPDEEAAG